MTTYQGLNDRYTIIEPCRASGGEGEIFDIRGKKDLVLKRLSLVYKYTLFSGLNISHFNSPLNFL